MECTVKWRKEHVETFEGRAVVIVRNPYKAIVSYWNYIHSGQLGIATEESFNSDKFVEFVFRGALRWFELIEDWIKFGKDVYFIFYENMLDSPTEEARKLLQYLGLPVDENRISCLLRDYSGKFHREQEQRAIPFTTDHHRLLRIMIEKANKIIRDNTRTWLPIEKYQEYQNFTEC